MQTSPPERSDTTSAYAEASHEVDLHDVYLPQHDSNLLVETMLLAGLHRDRRVADLCTGSGVVAISAATGGAGSVMAFDASIVAVRRARENARAAGVEIDVQHGNWSRATDFGRFDVVLCNPPYVPQPATGDLEVIPRRAGPALAFNAGVDGRLILDPLCRAAPALLAAEGTMLLVHSEFAGVEQSLTALRDAGLSASVVARQRIPFGPVLLARAAWLERNGRLEPGRRVEELVVVRADAP